MVPGFGQQPRYVVTIQPVGTTFNPPAAIAIPNVDGLGPSAKTEMYPLIMIWLLLLPSVREPFLWMGR